MPGFVDVSNMTSEQVRRMGHADDYDTPDTWKPRAHPSSVHQVGYAVSDVWAAACAAQRINGGYYKDNVYDSTKGMSAGPKHIRNREVMMQFLQNPDQLLVDDVETGEELQHWLQNDLTFRALKSQLTSFDSAAQKCLVVKDKFYTVGHRYELAVIAALPSTFFRAKAREKCQDRLAEASGKCIGLIGDKMMLDIEVIRTASSKTWSVNFVTAITKENHAVFFSFKQNVDVGTHHTIMGTVKAHKDGQTQLNRVSFI